jgi:putative ABC transport system substrate-binding protein
VIPRRQFITLLGGAVAAWPVRAKGQSERKRRVGIIDDAPAWKHFRQALRDLGYIEGHNITFDYRIAEGSPQRLAAAAVELVRLPVDVIAVYGTPASRAAQASTTSIPIVAISVGEPVRIGLVQSLARPGGNITGIRMSGQIWARNDCNS